MKGERVCAQSCATNAKRAMNKLFVKALALFLLAMMILSAVACSTPNDGEETTADTTASSEETTGGSEDDGSGNETTGATETLYPVDKDGYQLDDLPDDLNINDEICVLYWSDVEMTEFKVEEPTGHNVDDQIYWRNTETELRLGVTFKWIGTPGNNNNRNPYADFLGASLEAGDRTYDIMASYSRTTGICAARGYLADLNTIEDSYIDLEKPWWPQSLVDTVTIGDSMYFISGDISTNTLHFMYGVFCNQAIRENNNLQNPVDLVKNHEWTLEAMINMCEGIYSDLDSDGTKSSGDQFGLVSVWYGYDAFFTGSGLLALETDDEDGLVLSPSYYGEKSYALIELLQNFTATQDCLVIDSFEAPFVEERALFAVNRMYFADRKLKSVSFKYSIVPIPMYDGDQESYITVVGNPFSLWGIISNVSAEDQQKFTAVLECLASYGYRKTTPAIFEINYQSKYSETDDDSLMFNYIRDGVCYDLGRIFYTDLLGLCLPDVFTRCATNPGEAWASVLSANKRNVSKRIEKLYEQFESYN